MDHSAEGAEQPLPPGVKKQHNSLGSFFKKQSQDGEEDGCMSTTFLDSCLLKSTCTFQPPAPLLRGFLVLG